MDIMGGAEMIVREPKLPMLIQPRLGPATTCTTSRASRLLVLIHPTRSATIWNRVALTLTRRVSATVVSQLVQLIPSDSLEIVNCCSENGCGVHCAIVYFCSLFASSCKLDRL